MSDGTGSALTWAGIITAVTALVGTFLPYLKRKDERVDRQREERDKLRSSIDSRVLSELERLEAKISRFEKREHDMLDEIRALERDRDRGWDLARTWSTRAHTLWHYFANQLQPLNLALERVGQPRFVMPESLPSLEKINLEEYKPDGHRS